MEKRRTIQEKPTSADPMRVGNRFRMIVFSFSKNVAGRKPCEWLEDCTKW